MTNLPLADTHTENIPTTTQKTFAFVKAWAIAAMIPRSS